MRVQVKIDGDRATQEFKDARREINRRLKEGLQKGGEKIALPAAKGFAPVKTGRLRSSLIVRATARRAVITTNLRGKKGRYVGLLEYGGTIRARLRPKKAKALFFNGRFVSEVVTPRTIKPRGFLQRAVHTRRAAIQAAVGEEVMEAFNDLRGS
jgi:acyl dehydratase